MNASRMIIGSVLLIAVWSRPSFALLESQEQKKAPTNAIVVMEARLDGIHVCENFDNREAFLKDGRHFSELPISATPIVEEDDYLGIAFFDEQGTPISAKTASVDEIRLIANGSKEPFLTVRMTDELVAPYAEKVCIPIGPGSTLADGLRNLKHRTLITAQVRTSAATTLNRYALRENAWEPYGWNAFDNGYLGVWFPVGLLGSNLKKSDEGYNFSAMPIGVAIGGRYWFSDKFYIGLSGALNWSIATTDVAVTDPTTMMESKKSVTTAKAIGYGAIVDFGGLAYVGYMYQNDLSQENHDPGSTLVVGPGPGLIKLLAELAKQ